MGELGLIRIQTGAASSAGDGLQLTNLTPGSRIYGAINSVETQRRVLSTTALLLSPTRELIRLPPSTAVEVPKAVEITKADRKTVNVVVVLAPEDLAKILLAEGVYCVKKVRVEDVFRWAEEAGVSVVKAGSLGCREMAVVPELALCIYRLC